jgi:hypothetical protein
MDGKKGGSRPTLHLIDGKQMTVNEIGAMLGVTRRWLIQRRSQMGGISYQVIVNMFRERRLLTNHDRWPRHLVHGRWMTVQQAAQELDCKPHSIENWRSANRDKDGKKPTMEAAYDHFKGAPKRGRGKEPEKHLVNGKKMTVREAAEKYGTTANALRQTMSSHRCSLNAAVKRLEDRRIRKAQRDIMEILKGGK